MSMGVKLLLLDGEFMNSRKNNLIKLVTYLLICSIAVIYGFDISNNSFLQQSSLNTINSETFSCETREYIFQSGDECDSVPINESLSNTYLNVKTVFRNSDAKKRGNNSSLAFILLMTSVFGYGLCFLNLHISIVKEKLINVCGILKHRGPPVFNFI